jgi:hypothetical protein
MDKVGRSVMWLVLAAIGVLMVLSAAGAFLGAEGAKQFFNSIPLKVYWLAFALLFAAGFAIFPRLLCQPSSLLVHAGCLSVLIGGMWGSQSGHQLAKRFLGIDKIPDGYMVIYEGQSENRVVAEDLEHILGQLPFSIKLNDFRLEYYEDEKSVPKLNIETQDGKHLQISAKAGEEISLGDGKGKLKIVRTFTNFKIHIENGEKIATDKKGAGENPAVEVEIARPDGTTVKRYIFERFASHFQDTDGLQISYVPRKPQMIRDYFSDVAVIKDGKDAVSKTIEVNHPLHYGGYHFYQYSYDSEEGEYTILSVTSDSGLYIVYTGYWLLSVGVLWQFWLRPILKAKSAVEV